MLHELAAVPLHEELAVGQAPAPVLGEGEELRLPAENKVSVSVLPDVCNLKKNLKFSEGLCVTGGVQKLRKGWLADEYESKEHGTLDK